MAFFTKNKKVTKTTGASQLKVSKETKSSRKKLKKVDSDALKRSIRDSSFSQKRKVVKVTVQKKGFLLRTYTQQQTKYLDLMRIPLKTRVKYARNRIVMPLMIILFGSAFGLLLKNNYILMGGIALGVFMFFQKGWALKGQYKRYQFRQELAFAKFFSNLAPNLTKVVNGQSMYQVLLLLAPRLDNPESRKIVRQFMLAINEKPSSDEPYIDVARAFSNSPESVTQMLAVSQIAHSGSQAGMKVVRRLARSSADELMAKVDAIINAKKRKFYSITTQITMASMPMIFGIVVGMIIAQMTSMFSTLHLG